MSIDLAEALWVSDPAELPKISPRIAYGFVGKDADIASDSYQHVQQVHGCTILPEVADFPQTLTSVEADGLATRRAGVRLAVKTADCLPVLLFNPKTSQIMALHAGWRGVAQGIHLKGLSSFTAEQGGLASTYAVLGPCISPFAFEIGPEVLVKFDAKALALGDKEPADFAFKGKNDRWHLDLASLTVYGLLASGLPAKNVSVLRSCTFFEDKLWYSYRREGKSTGRIWSWIEVIDAAP